MKLQIGDIVKQTVWGQKGQIVEEYKNFWAVCDKEENFKTGLAAKEWLERQAVPFTIDEIETQRWFDVNLFDCGAILCCEGKLEFIERINIDNLLSKS